MRCYNGCPDSQLQAHLDGIAALRKELTRLDPDMHCVYFPNGEFYQIFVGFRPIGEEFADVSTALRWAIEKARVFA